MFSEIISIVIVFIFYKGVSEKMAVTEKKKKKAEFKDLSIQFWKTWQRISDCELSEYHRDFMTVSADIFYLRY